MGLIYQTTVSDIAGGPPANPSTGDSWFATNVDANGTRWHFQYNAGSASAYKWEFVGGASMQAHYDYPGGLNIGNSTTTSIPATAITIPRAGDYLLNGTVNLSTNTTSGSVEFIGFFLKGATPLSNAGTSYFGYPVLAAQTGGLTVDVGGIYPATGLAASDVITCGGYCNAAGTNTATMARLFVTPVRIS